MQANPFLDPAGIDPSLLDLAQRLTRVEGLFPATSQADDSSYYSRAGGLDLEQTQHELLYRTALVCTGAMVLGGRGLTLSDDVVRWIHDGIFEPVFGEQALGFRRPPGRHEQRLDDGVTFPIWIEGPRGATTINRHGVVAKQVLKRVKDACRDFEDEVPSSLQDREASARSMARIYTRLIRIHPFADGNGRTAWAALQLAGARLGFPFVQSSPTIGARLALGRAIRDGNDLDPLAAHIMRSAWES